MSDDGAEVRLVRRALLRRAVLLAAAGSVLGIAAPGEGAAAEEKVTQKDADYQTSPKDGQSCATCEFFTRPSACKIVKGKVSPQGWCSLFSSKTQ